MSFVLGFICGAIAAVVVIAAISYYALESVGPWR